MSSVADNLLSSAFLVNLRIHGEALGYIPASVVQVAETGEAITDEQAVAALSEEREPVEIVGIFDNDHAIGLDVMTTTPAAIVLASDVDGIQRGALIIRASVTFYVMAAQEPQSDGSQVLLLSKNAH